MYPTSIVPVIIHGRKLGMQWTMGSLIAAEKVFGFFADDKGFAKATVSYAEEHGFRALKVALGFPRRRRDESPDDGGAAPDSALGVRRVLLGGGRGHEPGYGRTPWL